MEINDQKIKLSSGIMPIRRGESAWATGQDEAQFVPNERQRQAIEHVHGPMLVVAEVPHAWWLVLPSSPHGFNWIDVAAMFAVMGIAAGVSLSGSRLPLMPQAIRQNHA